MNEDLATRLKSAFGGLDMKTAMRLTFNKCPDCGERMVRGSWLRWCPDRSCQGYVGVLNKELGKTIDYILPRTDEEQAQMKRLADEFKVETS